MAKKLETVKLVASLEKAARKTKKAIWSDLAEKLMERRRAKKQINLDKLSVLAKQFKGKTLVVPGKVLAKGELTEKVTIVAVSASESAKKK
jgi:large subunit ribosomal protein L18e